MYRYLYIYMYIYIYIFRCDYRNLVSSVQITVETHRRTDPDCALCYTYHVGDVHETYGGEGAGGTTVATRSTTIVMYKSV
jgi:hypothetical protein